MRPSRQDLIIKALRALDEVAEQAHEAPVEPSYGLSFILAFLYSLSDGRRDPYDDLWREMQERHDTAPKGMDQYMRSTRVRTNIKGIMRGLGCPGTVEFSQLVSVGCAMARRAKLANKG